MEKSFDPASLLGDLVAKAKKSGADQAEAVYADHSSTSVAFHNRKMETLERADSIDIGLRVFVGQKIACLSTTDRRPDALNEIVDRAIFMAKNATDDPFATIADPSMLTHDFPDLELADPTDVEAETLIAWAKEAEDAAASVQGVTMVDGARSATSRSSSLLLLANGFSGRTERTHSVVSASVIAGADQNMVTDYAYEVRVFGADLPSASSVGLEAAQRAVGSLAPRQMPTCQVPVVFDPREAEHLLQSFLGAVSGGSIARGTSFLKDKRGQLVFNKSVTIQDDPFIRRGLRSRVFDGEGLAPQRRALVQNGVLQEWILDLRSAKKLGLPPTGHASRGLSGSPSPSVSNVWIEAGQQTPKELMADIKQGFYVTQTMGTGIDTVSGNYSQAASGFWIENGEIAFPVHEMTIASTLQDMFLNLTPANDLRQTHGIDAPTLRIEGMTVAGG